MKLNELVAKATEELKTEEEQRALAILKDSISEVAAAKKTLRRIEKIHAKLLDTDLDDLELDDYEY